MDYVLELESFFDTIDSDIKEADTMLESALQISRNKKELYWMKESAGSKIKEKIKEAINKIKDTLKKLVGFFSDRKFTNTLGLTKGKSEKILVNGDPEKNKQVIEKGLKWIKDNVNKYKNLRGYNKVAIPIAGALTWKICIPGSTETAIALTSLGDFLLDYKRMVNNEGAPAIEEFTKWCESQINTMEETDIYQIDKISSRIASWVGLVSSEVKRICLSIAKKGFKAAKKVSKDRSTLNKASDILDKKSDKALDKHKKYREKFLSTKKKQREIRKESKMQESVNEIKNIILEVGDGDGIL